MRIFGHFLFFQAGSLSTPSYPAFSFQSYVLGKSRLFSTLTHIPSVMHLLILNVLMHKTHTLFYTTHGCLLKNSLKGINSCVLQLGYFNLCKSNNVPNMVKKNKNANVCTCNIAAEKAVPLFNSSLCDFANLRADSVFYIMNKSKSLKLQLELKRNVFCSRRKNNNDVLIGTKTCVKESIPQMTWKEWRHVFLSSALPMIGFGVMDQLIMIRAGDLIDNTIGVTFGLATLSAAAVGQLCSDTSGVLFGNAIDSIAQTFGLSPPQLTQEQRGLPSFRLATTLGAAFGVAFGCILGMVQLLFMDLDKAERLKRQKELDTIFEMVMSDGPKLFHCERGTLFVFDKSKGEIWSKAVFGLDQAIRIHRNKSKSFTTWVLNNKEILNCKDAYKDSRFNPVYDQKYKYKTRSVLAAPVVDKYGEVMAVLMFINKHEADGGVFTVDDERMMEMMCKHVQIFMEKFDYGAADDKRMISLREDEVCQNEVSLLAKGDKLGCKGEACQILQKKESLDKRRKSNESLATMCSKPLVNVGGLISLKDVAAAALPHQNSLRDHEDPDLYRISKKLQQWLSGVVTGVASIGETLEEKCNDSKQGYHCGVSIGRCVESDTVTSSFPFFSSLSLSSIYPSSFSLKNFSVGCNQKNSLPSNVSSTLMMNKDSNENLHTPSNLTVNHCDNSADNFSKVSSTFNTDAANDTSTIEHRRPPYWNLHYPHLYDYQHHLKGKIVEINRGEDF